jgi:hypothetical protein
MADRMVSLSSYIRGRASGREGQENNTDYVQARRCPALLLSSLLSPLSLSSNEEGRDTETDKEAGDT